MKSIYIFFALADRFGSLHERNSSQASQNSKFSSLNSVRRKARNKA